MSTKLHPISVPYRIFQASPGLIGLLFLVSFAAQQMQAELLIPVATGAFIIGGGLIVVWQVAYYRRFEYELTPDTFDIRSGVISRRNREIPYRRIQNVDISRSMVQRVLGISEIRLETAGGSTSEAHLRYVGYDEAKRLQQEVAELTRSAEAEEGETRRAAPRGEDLYRISTNDLGVLAVASFDLRVASFLAVILSITAPSVLVGLVLAAPIDPIFIVLAIVLIVVILSGILSGGSAIVNNYGFTLQRVGDELRYERGLLQRYDGTIPLEKIQTLILQENLIMRHLEYASLTVETAGYAPGQGGAESSRAVPISRRESTVSIAQEIEPFELTEFERPARQARVRYAWQYTIVLSILTSIGYGVNWWIAGSFSWWLVLTGIALMPFAAHYKWKHRGYAITDEYVLLRSGFWRRQTHLVPYYRLQTVDEVQSILQRRWGIATVVVDTAGSSGLVSGHPTAYDLDDRDSTELREHLSRKLQESVVIRQRRARMREHLRPRGIQGVRGIW